MPTPRERFQKLFRGNEDWFGQYEADPRTGAKIRAWTKAGPVPDEAWDRHLAGDQTGIGVVPITDEGLCYWGAIDLDDDRTDHAALVSRVRALGLPFVVCRSKSGGAHLFLFFAEPLKPVQIIAKLKRWSLELQLSNPVDNSGRAPALEIFPKQITLDDGQKGNWLNLPYFSGDDTNRYAFNEDGHPLTLIEFLDFAESRLQTELTLKAKQADAPVDSAAFFIDGPPCLAALHETGFPRGTRNNGLYNVGIFLKLKHPDDWEQRLRSYNSDSGRVDPPLPDDEMDVIVRSLGRRDYVYKCSDAPIVGVCQRGACKKQAFGISKFRSNENHAALPSMNRLISFENGTSDPPVYELEVNGESVLLNPDELLTLSLFRKAVFRQRKVVVPALKQHEWDDQVRGLIADHVVVEVPKDVGPHGQFVALLREFLMLRHKSDKLEDVLDKKPWEMNGKIYFKSQGLVEFLERKRFRELNSSIGIWSSIRREGGGFTALEIAGAIVDVWWMPIPQGEQTQNFKETTGDGPEF